MKYGDRAALSGASTNVQPNSVLVKTSTLLPASLAAIEADCFPGWKILKGLTTEDFHSKIAAAGWRLFFSGDRLSLTNSGRSIAGTTDKLIGRLVRVAEHRQCNCIEVIEIEVQKALFFANVRLDAQPRHVQKGSAGEAAKGVIR